MIQIVGPRLSQWDTGRSLGVSGSSATHAHLANRGDSHAVIMELVNGETKIPDYLLQTGKDLCIYLVLDGITQESKTFSVQKREKPENYVYEEDRRNYIYELITNAQTATDAANQAAQAANDAAVIATNAANNFTFIGDAYGTNMQLDKAAEQPIGGLRILGKTTQNGTPTPANPVELVSVASRGSVTVNIACNNNVQSMTVATPNGLCGIPVRSGGNYTDANGQQWICDEVDMGRGVHIQRVYVGVFDGSADESITLNTGSSGMASRYSLATPSIKSGYVLCNYAESSSWDSSEGKVGSGMEGSVVQVVYIGWSSKNTVTVAEFKTILSQKPLVVAAPLATPIETPLSAEEIAAYNTLHTYRGNTIVSNDASAHMELEYFKVALR